MSERKPIIYIACFDAPAWGPGNVQSCALAEDGEALAAHVSSGRGWAQHDMGITSDWKHDAYGAHYPNGYVLEWVEDPSTDPGYQTALALNHEQHPVEEEIAAIAEQASS